MIEIDKSSVIEQLKQKGNYNNDRMIEYIDAANHCYSFQLESSSFLSSLVFHFHKATQVLTPTRWWGGGRLYPLKDVVSYMQSKHITFEKLANGSVQGSYCPSFFTICNKIDQSFDYQQFGSLVLRPLTFSESKDCPRSYFRIIDGMHRALVLAYKSQQDPLFFQPIHCLLISQ